MNPVNALYVTTQGAYLRKDHENVVVVVDRAEKLRAPLSAVASIVCFGRVSASPELLAHCSELGIGVAFLSESGRFLCRLEGEASGNVLLRREQYRAADDSARRLEIARCFVAAKIQSSRETLRRALSDHGHKLDRASLEQAMAALEAGLRGVTRVESLDALRGVEGSAAAAYFAVFDQMIVAQRDVFRFKGRNRRPPLDPVNALLSFVYTLMHHDCSSALAAVGLDHQVGYLHEDRPGRPSLALDMLEELRAPIADRLVLTLINREQVSPAGFRTRENGAVEMTDETRKVVLVEYQNRKRETLRHPFTEEETLWGLVPHVQAQLLGRLLRGDLTAYPAFVWH